ncbi:T9SS type A sorting domain-containing protein [Lutimonas zeaxanthinifaciens]|uniref:T9SS type A sorting domain-containing protein n=1 Tax=Lutimonas zeaxanthinifaciens TaxID=3060215 RepID=UPI00265D1FDB|nr:T9SS type A sorting domain-containing protein [Lutimonas sp. YSD2104]WKK65652.1 T9SS type A sorting domain-containing protein [Lutimonas sp. YSD2104]
MIKALPLLFFIFTFLGFSQDFSRLTFLSDDVAETSGLIFFSDRLITHNDSEGMNALYEINVETGNVIRTVEIGNATNVDWEDICHDTEFIYVGDFGNNNGNRKNLRVYKISKADYLNSENVAAEIIDFSYADQNDFESAPNDTNFDAEALIAFGPDLFIFTKNWVDQRTNIYKLPKTPGTYEIQRIDEFNASGLVTGGTYNSDSNKVLLTGYSGIRAFLIELSGFSNGIFSNGTIEKNNLNIPLSESFQTEAIAYSDASQHYISAEKNALGDAALYSLISETLSVENYSLDTNKVFPNPASDFLNVDKQFVSGNIEIYSLLGEKVFDQVIEYNKALNISNLTPGIYILKLSNENITESLKFIKE